MAKPMPQGHRPTVPSELFTRQSHWECLSGFGEAAPARLTLDLHASGELTAAERIDTLGLDRRVDRAREGERDDEASRRHRP